MSSPSREQQADVGLGGAAVDNGRPAPRGSLRHGARWVVGANGDGRVRPRVIAFYLPQFHPIPENDRWWGRGFTEWTNVGRARRLYPGHYQPRVPADLGYYDLRVPETRTAQAELAAAHGVEGFCWWHYWFAGRRLLERPFGEVLESGEPDYPFCLGWANDSWTGVWYGERNRILVEQSYPGVRDYERHFYAVLDALADQRYLTVDGRPIFYVYKPRHLPEPREFADTWRRLAEREGLPGLYLVGEADRTWVPSEHGFDARVAIRLPRLLPSGRLRRLARRWSPFPVIKSYASAQRELVATFGADSLPCVLPNWDNTPRSGRGGAVLHGSTPELFAEMVDRAIDAVSSRPPAERLIFVKSWNEWAEGNHLEPDLRYGLGYLEALRAAVVVDGPGR
jgi:hypothetical protein